MSADRSVRRENNSTDRRSFLKTAAGTMAGLVAASPRVRAQSAATPAAGANEKIVVAIMGLGIRGPMLAEWFAERDDCEIAWICDPDSRRIEKPAKFIEGIQHKRPKTTQDFRQMIDDKDVGAIVVATPDHWHAIPTVLACQAGKDVYVEKPVAHNIWEGRKMVEAARKYKRIVQVGTQSRSSPDIHEAIQYIRDGKLGKVHLVRVLNMKWRDSIGHKKDEPAPPPGVDYPMWLGPAPMRPFNPNHFHYSWHWFWDYSGGDIINDAVHQLDIARWVVGQDHPKSAVCAGGKYFFDDDQETPDTQIVSYDFGNLTMIFELTLWTPYMVKTELDFRDTEAFPDWQFNSTKVEVYGSRGKMYLGRQGDGWQAFGEGGKLIGTANAKQPHRWHVANFLDCIRTRKTPAADIEVGHLSTLLAHYGNISYRTGNRKLAIDPVTDGFVDDAEANALLKRTYREPWVIPENV